MKKPKTLIVANWKMNPETAEKAREIFLAIKKAAKGLKNTEVLVCPPYIYLSALEKLNDRSLELGAQDVFSEEKGSFTGEISPTMLKNEGEGCVIVGHSERRQLGETDDLISRKVFAALSAKLKVILCIGEKERDAHGEYLLFLRDQLINSLEKVPRKYLSKLIIAYEPVWAIGKSADEAMTPGNIHETTIFIKKTLTDIYGQKESIPTCILYGGSVSAENARELLTQGEVQGLLIGRESLNPKRFTELLLSVDR